MISNNQIISQKLNFLDVNLLGEPKGISSISFSPIVQQDKKDYIVIVKEGFTIDSLQNELVNDTSSNNDVDSNIVPDRPVEISNPRPGSDRQTHFYLTKEEADKLKADPRVLDVELNPTINPYLSITLNAIDHTPGTGFKKLGLSENPGINRNYALFQCANNIVSYGTNQTSTQDDGKYRYMLDGTGVDVVVMDDGILVDHPEFINSANVSRVQQIDWFAEANVVGTMPAQFYTDSGSGHGTHVASTIAGKYFGWAKNANILSMKILSGTGDIDTLTAFDLIKNYHINKPVDPVTKIKRPTIVNGSWTNNGYYISSKPNYDPYSGMTVYVGYQLWGGRYRGIVHNLYWANVGYGVLGTLLGYYANGSNNNAELYRTNGFSAAYDAALQDMINAGVIYVKAAGNDSSKVTAPGDPDYDNYYFIIDSVDGGGNPVLTSNIFYNRPNSPTANGVINVGSTWYLTVGGTRERRAYYSHFGSGVDLYAPGTGIVAAYNNSTPSLGAQNKDYYRDFYSNVTNFFYYMANDSGTSMAAPQVAGLLTLYLQANPHANAYVCRDWVVKTAFTNVLVSSGSNTDYSNTMSISGGANKFLRNPYFVSEHKYLSNGLVLTDGSITFT